MTPPRGFPAAEFRARVARAQALMAQHDLGALLVTTEADLRYFSGFLTRFWESPTRPWFLIVPAQSDPVAVIPAIGAPLMARGWITDIRTWRAPQPGDDGVSLLIDTLRELAPSARIGLPDGLESHVRMPWADLLRVSQALTLTGDHGILRTLRQIKSPAEIAKIENACAIATRAFDRVGDIAQPGVPLSQVFRRFQALCLDEGADWVPYLAGGAGPDGYGDVISPATDAPLARGDVLMLDTGLVWDGYFCDFDRNFALGPVGPLLRDAHARLIDATAAATQIARPGTTAADLFHAMDRVVTGGRGGSEAGRYGHGLGMQLTEGLSLIPADHTVLEPGMVLTLEPGIETRGGMGLVHEENIVIEPGGARPLTQFATPDLKVI